MLTCWLFGHRYEYELKLGPSQISLICTKCGNWRTLTEIQISPSPGCTPSAPPRSNPDHPL
jgi:hypothetical protein